MKKRLVRLGQSAYDEVLAGEVGVVGRLVGDGDGFPEEVRRAVERCPLLGIEDEITDERWGED